MLHLSCSALEERERLRQGPLFTVHAVVLQHAGHEEAISAACGFAAAHQLQRSRIIGHASVATPIAMRQNALAV